MSKLRREAAHELEIENWLLVILRYGYFLSRSLDGRYLQKREKDLVADIFWYRARYFFQRHLRRFFCF